MRLVNQECMATGAAKTKGRYSDNAESENSENRLAQEIVIPGRVPKTTEDAHREQPHPEESEPTLHFLPDRHTAASYLEGRAKKAKQLDASIIFYRLPGCQGTYDLFATQKHPQQKKLASIADSLENFWTVGDRCWLHIHGLDCARNPR